MERKVDLFDSTFGIFVFAPPVERMIEEAGFRGSA
jgi:hypothetical protein